MKKRKVRKRRNRKTQTPQYIEMSPDTFNDPEQPQRERDRYLLKILIGIAIFSVITAIMIEIIL